MKFTSGLVLSALAVAASSPTVSAAPFPGGRAASGSFPNAGNEEILKSPEPEGPLSPRARGLERFGGPPPSGNSGGQRKASGGEKRKVSSNKHERRQLPSLAGLGLGTPPLNGLGLDPSLLSSLAGQATAPLAGLGLGGLTNTVSSLPGQLASNPSGTLNGLLSTTLGTVNSLPVAGPALSQVESLTGLNALLSQAGSAAGDPTGPLSGLVPNTLGTLNSLPVAGPVLGQVEGLTGLNGLLGQAGTPAAGVNPSLNGLLSSTLGTVNGLPVAGPILGQVEGLTGLNGLLGQAGHLTPGSLGGLPLGNLQQALLAQATQIQQLQTLLQQAGLPANLAQTPPGAAAVANSVAQTAQNPSLTNAANTANNAINAATSSTDSATPRQQGPPVTDTFVGANQALNPLLQGAMQGSPLGIGPLGGIAASVPDPSAQLADLIGQLNGLAAPVPHAGSVLSQVQAAAQGLQGQVSGATAAVQGAAAGGSAPALAAGAQNALPSQVQGALDPNQWQVIAQQIQQLQQAQQLQGLGLPVTGKVLAANAPAPAAAAAGQAPAPPHVADSLSAPDLSQPAAAAVESAIAIGTVPAVNATAIPTLATATTDAELPTATLPYDDGCAGGCSWPKTSLSRPITESEGQPTSSASDQASAATAAVAASTSSSSWSTESANSSTQLARPMSESSTAAASPSTSDAVPVPTALSRRQALPERFSDSSDLADTDNYIPYGGAGEFGDEEVIDQESSDLDPLAPDAAAYLQNFVDGYQPPVSPADSFVSAWSSAPLPSAPLSALPTPPVPALPKSLVSSSAVLGVPTAPAQATTIAPSAPQTTVTPPPIPARSKQRLRRQVPNDAPKTGDVKSAPSPYPGWSQDTDFSHADPQANNGKKPKRAKAVAEQMLTENIKRDLAAVEGDRKHPRDWARRAEKAPSSFETSGKSGRPPMLRQRSYRSSDKEHVGQDTMGSLEGVPAAGLTFKPVSQAEQPAAKTTPILLNPRKSDTMAHQPPAGEHGQPPAAHSPVASSSSPASTGAQKDTAASTASAKTSGKPKKRWNGRLSLKRWLRATSNKDK